MAETQKTILCLGFFDGVHLGHRAILQKGVELAEKIGARAAVLTFDRHPMSVITGRATPMIDTFERRIELLRNFEGISAVETVEFTKELANMGWREFFENILLGKGNIAGIVAGFDYSFGAGGLGRADNLLSACNSCEIACEIVPAVTVSGKKVSSTLIRELVSSGEIGEANRLLGRPFEIWGKIEEGRHIARTLGFPTLNMRLEEGTVRPKFGVYISLCSLGDDFRPAITNIGLRPTITDGAAAVETHLLFDSPGEAYGKPSCLKLLEFLRGERLFENRDDLKAQVDRDISSAGKWLEANQT